MATRKPHGWTYAAHGPKHTPRKLQPDTEWAGEVEGDDYLITRNMAEVTE